MGRKHNQNTSMAVTAPHRGDIWWIPDDTGDMVHNGSIQKGTRFCIVISDDRRNARASDVEIVYVTTKVKNEQPTHFFVRSTPEPSVVICEQVMTVPKKKLAEYHGAITKEEGDELAKCLRISLWLKPNHMEDTGQKVPHRGEIWYDARQDKPCIIVSNDVGNMYSPVVEVVYTGTWNTAGASSYFMVDDAREPFLVYYERIMTIPKTDLVRYQGKLQPKEQTLLDKCLKRSLGLWIPGMAHKPMADPGQKSGFSL